MPSPRNLIFTCLYLVICASQQSASGTKEVELRPQQHLNLLPAITVTHFSNNSGFELRCENPFSNHEVVKTEWKYCDNGSVVKPVFRVLELLDGGRTLLWHAFPEKSFQNDIHSNNIKCEHTFDGGGDGDGKEKTEEVLRISSHCIHIKAVIDDAPTTTTSDPIRLRVSNKYPVKVGYPTILKCEVDGRRPSSTENLLSIEGWIWNATQKENQYAILPSGDLVLTTVSTEDKYSFPVHWTFGNQRKEKKIRYFSHYQSKTNFTRADESR